VSTDNCTGSSSASFAYVLDDEPQVAAIVCQVLAACNFKPRQFTSPGPLFEAIENSTPELIVLDLALGQSDAIEVIRQLGRLKFPGRVLLMSGRDHGTLLEITKIGERHGLAMLHPLTKPFRVGDLKSRLASAPAQHAEVEQERRERFNRDTKLQLCDALRNQWLEVWYQPKIDLKSLSICGAEALVRARHPEHGVILPENLLPPAGDPAYHPLSQFVIEQTMTDWWQFAAGGMPLKLAVNVPASVIVAQDFIGHVRRCLPTDKKFPGLIVEITEDEVIRDPDWIREMATQLKLYNVLISIDDFGSGYSSLARLNELPFVEVKIDRQFVDDCSANPLKHGLCQTVVDLAHRFGASVCAEGVENAADLRALINMRCDTAQGFVFAKAMPARDFLARMARHSGAARLHSAQTTGGSISRREPGIAHAG
jgi:EAL domain-containing protein (putative c-di-GMP-specific phosphodiesterase class I)/ActR/RegA family two-component response regulator